MHLITQPHGSRELAVAAFCIGVFGVFLKLKPLRFRHHHHQKPYDSTVGLWWGWCRAL